MTRKRLLWAIILGAAIGEILAVWLAPKYIIWYFDPPVEMGFNCKAPIAWALARLQTTQLFALGVGAVLGLTTLFVFSRRGSTSEYKRIS